MPRRFWFIMSLIGVLLGGGPAFAQDTGGIRIVTSFYPVYIMALNVTRDIPGVAVVNLTPSVTGCLHDYALTTKDMKKLAHAQVFAANGAGMESFLDRVIAQFPQMKVITISDGISLLKGAGGDNPHVWVSISHAITQIQTLTESLARLDPAHAAAYRRNGADYVGKLAALRDRMKRELAPYAGRGIITFHEAFPYFAREFGFHIAAVIEREPGSEPGAKELAATIDQVRESGIRVLFSEPQYPSLAAQTIARETGARVYILDPAVSGPDTPDAYLEIMEHNLDVLKNAFLQP